MNPLHETSASRPAIVLVQPRIPQNVGAIGRLCAAAQASLHVVRPIPFELSDRSLKRAAMDYLDLLDWHVHVGWEECRVAMAGRRMFLLSSHATRSIYDVQFAPSDVLVFGSEAAGAPPEVRASLAGQELLIPMREPKARCLNVAMSAGIALYEVLRQTQRLRTGGE